MSLRKHLINTLDRKKLKNSLNIKSMVMLNVYGTYMYHICIGGLERVDKAIDPNICLTPIFLLISSGMTHS